MKRSDYVLRKVSLAMVPIIVVFTLIIQQQAAYGQSKEDAKASVGQLPENKPGFYVNEEYRFSINYPESWKDDPGVSPITLLSVSAPSRYPRLHVYAPNVSEKLENIPKRTPGWWANMFPNSSGHILVSENMTTLACGTPAVEFVIEWTWGRGEGKEPEKIVTTVVAAKKDNQCIWVDSTNRAGEPIDINRKVCNSLRFYK